MTNSACLWTEYTFLGYKKWCLHVGKEDDTTPSSQWAWFFSSWLLGTVCATAGNIDNDAEEVDKWLCDTNNDDAAARQFYKIENGTVWNA